MHVLAATLSALVLPGFNPVSTGPAGGQFFSGRFPDTTRPGYVYLPPGFDPSRRYRVVYLLHGLPGSPSEYLHGAQFPEFADPAIADGTIRSFIGIIPAAGANAHYDGEWAGPWETALVDGVVPWVDAHLPTIASGPGRIIAGLSAGGFGAIDIALRHPDLFSVAESWSGYFTPLLDGPFTHASKATLAANSPIVLVRKEASSLRASGLRFLVSTGPGHSHLFKPAATFAFAKEAESLGLDVESKGYATEQGQWREQLAAGLTWALGP
jgi:enterochelin esterase-like enzyme